MVASGSEDGLIYIWHVNYNKPIYKLCGHNLMVGSLSKVFSKSEYMVSGSDDKQVLIWGPEIKECSNPNQSRSSAYKVIDERNNETDLLE